jgi:hypothetical protein
MEFLKDKTQDLSEKTLPELQELAKNNHLKILELERESRIAGQDAAKAMGQGNNVLFDKRFRIESENKKTIRKLQAEIEEAEAIALEKFKTDLNKKEDSKSRLFSRTVLDCLLQNLEKNEKNIFQLEQTIREKMEAAMIQSKKENFTNCDTDLEEIGVLFERLKSENSNLARIKEKALEKFDKKTI